MKKLFKIFMVLILIALLGVMGSAGYLWYLWSSNLPYIGTLKEYNPPIITEIFSDNGEVIGRFWDEKRILVTLEKLPKHLVNAFIATDLVDEAPEFQIHVGACPPFWALSFKPL